MAQRLLEVTLVDKEGAGSSLAELLEGRPVVHLWQSAGDDGRRQARILVDASDAEEIGDLLAGRYSGQPEFRVVTLPVEATYPAPPEPDQQETGETDTAAAPGAAGPRRRDRVSRDELYADLRDASRPTWLFRVAVALSSVVAAVGLLTDSVAVIIGAMVIAPLLGPNMALAFGATLGDLAFMKRALRANVQGAAIALGLAAVLGLLVTSWPGLAERLLLADVSNLVEIPSIGARTRVAAGDLVLALAAGAAGTLAFTSGTGAALVGVMVAVALLPPLIVVGMLAGAGEWSSAAGALMLAAANVICVNVAGVVTFLSLGVQPRAWWEREGARRSSRLWLIVWMTALLAVLVYVLVVS